MITKEYLDANPDDDTLLANANDVIGILEREIFHQDKEYKILEVGAFLGGATKRICKKLRDLNRKFTYVVVDPYADESLLSESKEFVYGAFQERIAPYPEVTHYREYSPTFWPKNEIKNYDFILLDGDHSFRGMRDDLIEASKILARPGIVMIDDANENAEILAGLGKKLLPGAHILSIENMFPGRVLSQILIKAI